MTQDNHTISSSGSAEIRWASKCREIVLLAQGNRIPEIFTSISSSGERFLYKGRVAGAAPAWRTFGVVG